MIEDLLLAMFKKKATTAREDLLEYIYNNVEELSHFWTQDFEDVYGERIWQGYLEECKVCGTELSPEEFVDDMDNSIGWDWVFDED